LFDIDERVFRHRGDIALGAWIGLCRRPCRSHWHHLIPSNVTLTLGHVRGATSK
jgi:hypothetical protein